MHTCNTDDRYSTLQPAQGTTIYNQQINTYMVVCKDICNLGSKWTKMGHKGKQVHDACAAVNKKACPSVCPRKSR